MEWFEIPLATRRTGLQTQTGKNNTWRNKFNGCQQFGEIQRGFVFLVQPKNSLFSSLYYPKNQLLQMFRANLNIPVLGWRGHWGNRFVVQVRPLTGKIPCICETWGCHLPRKTRSRWHLKTFWCLSIARWLVVICLEQSWNFIARVENVSGLLFGWEQLWAWQQSGGGFNLESKSAKEIE